MQRMRDKGAPWRRSCCFWGTGKPVETKGYYEPGGRFSPSPGSFGMAIWVLDSQNKLIAKSDDIPMAKIKQQYSFLNNNKIPLMVTQTPY